MRRAARKAAASVGFGSSMRAFARAVPPVVAPAASAPAMPRKCLRSMSSPRRSCRRTPQWKPGNRHAGNDLRGHGVRPTHPYDAGVSSVAPRSPPPPSPAMHVGALLREWRAARRLSQLDLSLQADVSSRHLSYVETGKAQPSREMVARLGDALAVQLRARNALMIAAGYAPEYGETSLATPEMAPVRRALEYMLAQQE